MKEEALSKAKAAARKVADSLGYQLYGVRAYTEGGTEFLEVLVDKDYQIDIDEIETYSNALSAMLDEIPELDSPYTLDVASPGLEREFPKSDLDKVVGRYIQVTAQLEKDQKVEGTVDSFDGLTLVLKTFIKGRKKIYRIPVDKIVKCRFLAK